MDVNQATLEPRAGDAKDPPSAGPWAGAHQLAPTWRSDSGRRGERTGRPTTRKRLAERVGFEPTEGLPLHLISRRVPHRPPVSVVVWNRRLRSRSRPPVSAVVHPVGCLLAVPARSVNRRAAVPGRGARSKAVVYDLWENVRDRYGASQLVLAVRGRTSAHVWDRLGSVVRT